MALLAAIRALAAAPEDRGARQCMHNVGYRCTRHEVEQALASLPESVLAAADVDRWTR